MPALNSNSNMVTQGITLIDKERQEQLGKHNRSILDDVVFNDNSELAAAAGALIWNDENLMPNNWDPQAIDRMFAKPRVERLVLAGALIAAEVDRLIYNEEQEYPAVSPAGAPEAQ